MQINEILSFCKCLNMKANFLWGSFIQDEYEKILKCKYIYVNKSHRSLWMIARPINSILSHYSITKSFNHFKLLKQQTKSFFCM